MIFVIFAGQLPPLEMNEVIINPKPKPPIIHPTNTSGEVLRKKNPMPIPNSRPPPIAQELLSVVFGIIENLLEISAVNW
jgi:hypothetical protein